MPTKTTTNSKTNTLKKKHKIITTTFCYRKSYELIYILLCEISKVGFLSKSDICRDAFLRHYKICTKTIRRCEELGLIKYIPDRKVEIITEKGLKLLPYLVEMYSIMDFPLISEYIKKSRLNDEYAQAYSELVKIKYKDFS